MGIVRAYFLQHRGLAFALVALALCLKVLIPGGYMLSQDYRTITLEICHDAGGASPVVQIKVPAKSSDHLPGKAARGECPYGALGMASLGGADPVLLALALAFIMALGFGPSRPALLARIAFLRPPLRGPPA